MLLAQKGWERQALGNEAALHVSEVGKTNAFNHFLNAFMEPWPGQCWSRFMQCWVFSASSNSHRAFPIAALHSLLVMK